MGEHNINISHGRRLQIDKKRRDKKLWAQRQSTYARSLVGWNTTSVMGDSGHSSGSRESSDEPESRTHGTLTAHAHRRPDYQSPIHIDSAEEEPHRWIGSPSTILKRGQSDPFNTLAVEVTPEANEILSFFRENVILSFYSTRWNKSKAAVVAMHWQTAVQTLHDRGSALGWLGRNGQILSIVSNDKRVKYAALRYTAQSTAILRERLEQAVELSDTDQWHISMLWGTEIIFQNLDAALLHGKMLRRIVENQARKGTLDLIAFRFILYYDINLCTMLMARSVFDYFDWVPDKYQRLEPLATRFMVFPPNNEEDDAATDLDPCIRGDLLLSIFTQRRRHMREYAWWLDHSFEDLNPILFGWLAVCHHICHGQLITHALDCMDNAETAPIEQGRRFLAEAYLCIAALYVTRAGAGGQIILRGIDIFEARLSMLNKLYLAMTQADAIRGHDSDPYQNAKLWALYVGARGARTLKKKPLELRWFARAFKQTRREMGLFSWTQTQSVLKGFLHYEAIDPIEDEIPVELVR